MYWRQKRVSRSQYVALAFTSCAKARNCFETKTTHSKCGKFVSRKVRNRDDRFEVGEKTDLKALETNSLVLKNRKSCGFLNIAKKASKKRGRSKHKQLPFIVNRKRVKKQTGFRRRSGNGRIQSTKPNDGGLKRTKMMRSRRKKKKNKVRQVRRQDVEQQLKPPEKKQLVAPSYHLSYKIVYDLSRKMRKGRSFRPSKRVLWRNRHSLVRASRELHRKTSYDEYNISASRDIEYDVPEPPEDDEDPQWLNTGPKYSSD